MMVKDGMKCLYDLGYSDHSMEDGEVLIVKEDGTFTCYCPMNCPAQYNDSLRDFTESDIGIRVFFYPEPQPQPEPEPEEV